MATVVDIVVAIRVGPIMLVGLVPPAADRIPIVVAGISVTEEVLIAKNITIAFVAVSLFLFNFCNSCIALSPNGKAYHSIIFYYIMKNLTENIGGVKQFKVRQTAIDRLEFHIVKSNNFSEKVESFIQQQIKEKFGDEMNLKFFYHCQINRQASGKLRDFETCLDTEHLVSQIYSSTRRS